MWDFFSLFFSPGAENIILWGENNYFSSGEVNIVSVNKTGGKISSFLPGLFGGKINLGGKDKNVNVCFSYFLGFPVLAQSASFCSPETFYPENCKT